ncbi:phospholipase D-like domain-containing protein [Paracoccus xiamenensis]|uniref:phospholipase D-like domain-containing protein n=1 Tax=Paracoccus xiamenensis TaxID=2714901 RepID=UPI00140CB6E9|nr:phospholipase D-like domain-containing protein [Paracoccus xiamenensis]NHF74003.1 hypothetical protein [Paracoccus xiamenensis]
MTLLIPAVWYHARAVIERRWGWSPIEEEILLALRERPGTSASVANELGIPHQVAGAAVSRLMRFGLIEVRIAPEPALAMTEAARAHLLAGRSLPERAVRREMTVSIVFDKLGGSVFRRREVVIKPVKNIPRGATIVDFPDDEAETDSSMEERVRHLLSSSLRPGEVFAMVRANRSLIEKRFIHLDLERARNGAFPDGASHALRAAVREHLASVRLLTARPSEPARPACLDTPIKTTLAQDQILFGGGDHLARLEKVVEAARSDVFVLSTFVAAQDDANAEYGQDRVWTALEHAVRRGVRVHLFFGSSLDDECKHTRAMGELQNRLRAAGAGVAAHLEPVHSHAKIVVADDGGDGALALLGSCNWLQSPFRAHELSIELRDGAVAECLDLFGAITAAVPSARGSRDAMQAMRTALRLNPSRLLEPLKAEGTIPVSLSILAAPDHLPLLRRAAHDAEERLVVMTHRMGSPMIQNVFDPAQLASERIATVQALYSVPSGEVKKRDVRAAGEMAGGLIDLRKVQSKHAMLHGKALLWDHDDIVVTSFNWGSQSASEDKPLDEIGLHLHGKGVADLLQAVLDTRVLDANVGGSASKV